MTDAGQDHVVFNADGIYLATYVTLLLNFELGKREYYPSRSGFVTQSEVFLTSYTNQNCFFNQPSFPGRFHRQRAEQRDTRLFNA